MEELPARISSPSCLRRRICDLRLGGSARLMGLDPFCCFGGESEREREREREGEGRVFCYVWGLDLIDFEGAGWLFIVFWAFWP